MTIPDRLRRLLTNYCEIAVVTPRKQAAFDFLWAHLWTSVQYGRLTLSDWRLRAPQKRYREAVANSGRRISWQKAA